MATERWNIRISSMRAFPSIEPLMNYLSSIRLNRIENTCIHTTNSQTYARDIQHKSSIDVEAERVGSPDICTGIRVGDTEIMEDLGIEAKDAAVREVAKLLPLPELLASIVSIKADYSSRQQANDAQLSTMVAEQDVGGMMSISVEAAAARDSLHDDRELIHTYERLTALDGKRRFALAAAGSHKEEVGRLRSEEYFEDVDQTWETFEKTLWGHISNFYRLGKERIDWADND
ncbi:hypothetical protein MA16_Dca015585 [Dendrobium catenatum]|uniref:Uncharacterized protein n=1 Tax=Dendrobium catenatum TaxID=906689 RepID=A0A2I0WKT4_9ASPA|nr:hypothetical protein MA16_Dca015585 [Dendrobium catenatum]